MENSLSNKGPAFHWRLRVYFEDTDAGGIVFYANYLKFFERARTEWLRTAGIEQQRLLDETGTGFVVRHTALDYFAPARLDDQLDIDSQVVAVRGASVDFEQIARRDTTILARGRIKVACVDIAALRPRALPPAVLAAFRPTDPIH